ncbi:MAG: DEAD/DEAH box helicase family protein [Muribaculaceae bacterium]|nr:DEAD/DEAH box helicase family protein [Muribaculaceae bacterium]
MELKQYQKDVIADLDSYIGYVEKYNRPDTAFHKFWEDKGISVSAIDNYYLHPYNNSITDVPHVTVKVPTAGGKTFIACNALKTIFSHQPAEKPKVVAWFVPSDTILKQTVKNLQDASHPYRQKIDSHFGNAVCVVDKESALFGHGISPTEIREQLTVFVFSVQSFAANNKDGRRVYRENENLAEYAKLYDTMTKRVEGSDETGLIQVLSYLNPVVIIDESHNFEADLRVEMLKSINPSFILDLTATPREKSNIISFVDAIKLKRANMVKLPVIVYNHRSTNDVIASAIQMQRSLEQKAVAMEAEGGRYIRPIVLFQAQPKTDNDNITFDKIKEKLIEIGIPESQIKIKTANKDEIKNTDLLSRDCPVRYIITVNALKEGWDCPFAYILASLANKTSRVDVEQILGRVLRLPYTTRHREELLDLSYVFTSSNNFRNTVENIIEGLNRAGFSKKDYRIAETQIDDVAPVPAELPDQNLFSSDDDPEQDIPATTPTDDIDEQIDTETIKSAIASQASATGSTELEAFARQENDNYNQAAEEQTANDDIPNDIKGMINTYPIKDIFAANAGSVVLPQFVKKVAPSLIFADSEYVPLDKTMLAEGFDLDKCDHNIDFTQTDSEAVRVDLEKSSGDEYAVTRRNLNATQLAFIRQHFATLSPESKQQQLAEMLAKGVRFDEIQEPQIVRYIRKAIDGIDSEQLEDLYTNDWQTKKTIRQKIESLLADHQKKKFKEWLDTGQIKCQPTYRLPERIIVKTKSIGLAKGLYTEEEAINGFEYNVINAVANLDNVRFWHRNPSRAGFCINGYINHYPDFIVQLNSGITVLIESKGDDRDNSDSRAKIDLGRTWANKAGEQYRYFMTFDKSQMEGAITLKELLQRLSAM